MDGGKAPELQQRDRGGLLNTLESQFGSDRLHLTSSCVWNIEIEAIQEKTNINDTSLP